MPVFQWIGLCLDMIIDPFRDFGHRIIGDKLVNMTFLMIMLSMCYALTFPFINRDTCDHLLFAGITVLVLCCFPLLYAIYYGEANVNRYLYDTKLVRLFVISWGVSVGIRGLGDWCVIESMIKKECTWGWIFIGIEGFVWMVLIIIFFMYNDSFCPRMYPATMRKEKPVHLHCNYHHINTYQSDDMMNQDNLPI